MNFKPASTPAASTRLHVQAPFASRRVHAKLSSPWTATVILLTASDVAAGLPQKMPPGPMSVHALQAAAVEQVAVLLPLHVRVYICLSVPRTNKSSRPGPQVVIAGELPAAIPIAGLPRDHQPTCQAPPKYCRVQMAPSFPLLTTKSMRPAPHDVEAGFESTSLADMSVHPDQD